MKKLYLLLTSSLVLLTGVGTLTTTVNGCTKGKEAENPTENPIYKELAKFNKNNPLEIIYDTNNPTPEASDPKTASNIRSSLKLKNKTIFTDEVTKKINFKSDQLKKDEPILVQATYEKKTTPIYVKEVVDIALLISNELEK